MARIDDYQNAKKIAAEQLAPQPFSQILLQSGYQAAGDQLMEIPFLNRTYLVRFPDFEFQDKGEADAVIPLQEQVLILHYLLGEKASGLSGRWVSYREIPGASFYYGAFLKRAVNPLKQVFGNSIAAFKAGAERLNGDPVKNGDAAYIIQAFPKVPVQLILWEGDEEFPAEGNILFDASIEKMLTPEDIAWLAGMVVYRIMALSR